MEKIIKSPADLNALRDKAKALVDLRAGEKEMRIVVHMGTCGIAAGARDSLSQVMKAIEQTGVKNVSVRLAGCLGLCDQEPMLTLTDRLGREYCYGRLDASRVSEIVRRHVIANEPIAEYIVSTG